ncbi:hypothetical protein MmonteBS_19920 [Mycobacterium montefiorense]|uniref:Uncharacterized protein n=2 Tax=Mycobacterium montefiorense TaxID=154654 RepID=A0ABQ0NLF0_9MYCO|nr:hypothetical protein MmonteBS_19920 [Mycobacterium montefiorense]GKU40075.1 hypothetical protein NJB14192_20630 [Mycobacterium montefiorense]GKU50440.1 hypothetical protein NJB14195_16860 [Mycobacterium montefiorense]
MQGVDRRTGMTEENGSHMHAHRRGGVYKALRTAVIAVVALIAVLSIPVKQRCGAPGIWCAAAVDSQGYAHYYYEVEPLGVYLVEIVTGSNSRLFYESGEDLEEPSHTTPQTRSPAGSLPDRSIRYLVEPSTETPAARLEPTLR